MVEQMTDRMKALMAIVDEANAKKAEAEKQGGSVLNQGWRFFTAYLPPPLLVVGVALFGGFHVWQYYNKSELDGYQTRKADAQAEIETLKSQPMNMVIDGQPVAVEKFRAEVLKKQAEAVRAQTEADALTAQAGSAEIRVASLAAQVRQKQAEAEKATLAAQASNTRFGTKTLEDRAHYQRKSYKNKKRQPCPNFY